MSRRTHRFLIDIESGPSNANVLIVGGGLYGLQLASELCYLGADGVLVIEAGDLLERQHIYAEYGADQATWMWLDPEHQDGSFWRPWLSDNPPHYAAWGGLRRKLGGRSLYWNGVCLRMEPWALTPPWWPETIVADLTQGRDGEKPLYSVIEEEVDKWQRFSSDIRAHDITLFSADFFKSMGYPAADMVWGMTRHLRSETGKVIFSAYTPLELWMSSRDQAILPKILCGAEVINVDVSNGEATGVSVLERKTGRQRSIHARRIVLAAGTIENSRLVIQALSATQMAMPRALNGLCDHIVQGFTVKIPTSELHSDILSLMPSGPLFLLERNASVRSNLFAQFSYDLHRDIVFDAWTMGEQMPNANSYVRCTRTLSGRWDTHVGTSLSEQDTHVVEGQRDCLRRLWDDLCTVVGHHHPSAIEFVEFFQPERTLPDVLIGPATALEFYKPISYASHLGTVEHEGCTLAYDKIIDIGSQVRGLNNVFAVGPSTFPRLGAANPALTAFALIRRLSHNLASL